MSGRDDDEPAAVTRARDAVTDRDPLGIPDLLVSDVVDLLAAHDATAEFARQHFRHDAFRKGYTWSHSWIMSRPVMPVPEITAPHLRHWERRVASVGETLSRMLGRIAGYRDALAEREQADDEGRSGWRQRTSASRAVHPGSG